MTNKISRLVLVGVTLAACGERAHLAAPPAPDGSVGPSPRSDKPFSPAEGGLRRLTEAQYDSAIHDLFGADVVAPVRLEPDVAIEGLVALGAARTSISPRGVEQYESAALDLATQALGTGPASARGRIVTCTPAGVSDDACARSTLAALGRRVFRRPLTAAELTRLVTLAGTAARALGDFHRGLELSVAALLESPHFLFRVELGEPDPAAPGQLRFSAWELASRLSFLLWNTIPDDALLDAAERGELLSDAGLDAALDRLLASPRARVGLRSFFTDLLELYRLDELVKDPKVFVQASPELGPAAREETLRGIEHLVFDAPADYRELLTTRRTFLDRRLAAVYEVQAPARQGFGMHVWSEDSPRAGLLTQASVLALHAHSTSSSATRRGKFVRKVLLCANPAPPPVDVNTMLPEPSGNTPTLRDRVAVHLQNENCAVCHRFTDPIGLGLENFDGVGRYRATENGAVIDAPGELGKVPFSNPRELAAAVVAHPDFVPCFVKSVYRYAGGHLETAGEAGVLEDLTNDFAAGGHRVLPLLRLLVKSPGFRRLAPPSDAASAKRGSP